MWKNFGRLPEVKDRLPKMHEGGWWSVEVEWVRVLSRSLAVNNRGKVGT